MAPCPECIRYAFTLNELGPGHWRCHVRQYGVGVASGGGYVEFIGGEGATPQRALADATKRLGLKYEGTAHVVEPEPLNVTIAFVDE
jgi:hypothetical protein